MKNIIFILLVILFNSVFSQSNFSIRIGTEYSDNATDCVPSNDGGYILTGTTFGFGAGGNMFITKLNNSGEVIWYKNLFGVNIDHSYDLIKNSKGQYAIVGDTYSFGHGAYDGLLCLFDEAGEILWTKVNGGIIGDRYYSVDILPDGGYIVGGVVDNNYGWIQRCDSIGANVWAKVLSAYSNFNNILYVDIDQYLAMDITSGQPGFKLFSFSSSGELTWTKGYFENSDESSDGYSIISTYSGSEFTGYLISGQSYLNAEGGVADVFLLKLDPEGEVEWYKRYGGLFFEWGENVIQTNDGGYAITGWTSSFGFGDKDGFLIKTDQDGELEWANTYGREWEDRFHNLFQNEENEYLLCGTSYSEGLNPDSSNVYFVKTNSLGETNCDFQPWFPLVEEETASPTTLDYDVSDYSDAMEIELTAEDKLITALDLCDFFDNIEQDSFQAVTINPNPMNLTSKITLPTSDWEAIVIMDRIGNKCSTIYGTGSKEVIFNKGNLQTGLYYGVTFLADKTKAFFKIVVQ